MVNAYEAIKLAAKTKGENKKKDKAKVNLKND